MTDQNVVQESEREQEEKDVVPLYVKVPKPIADILEKMTPLLYHYGLIPSPTKKNAISYCIKLTALMLKKYIESEGGRP